MKVEHKLWVTVAVLSAIFIWGLATATVAQDVAYCKHGQTGEVIVIEANYACPSGYYRI